MSITLFNNLEAGVQIYHYVDYPIWPTRKLVNTIYDELEKKRNSFYIPLSMAKPITCASDIAAKVTKIDFPITADRIEKFCTSTKFKADKIRKTGLEQPFTNDEAIKKTVHWHVNMVKN